MLRPDFTFNRREFLSLTVAAGSSVITSASAADRASAAPSLENSNLALTFDPKTGGLTEIRNKLTAERCAVDDPGFRIEAGLGVTTGTLGIFSPSQCAIREFSSDTPGHVRWVFAHGPLTVTMSYQLDPGDNFAVKRLRVEYSGQGTFNVRRLEMFDWELRPRPKRCIPYYGFLSEYDQWPGKYFKSLSRIHDGEESAPSDNSVAWFHRLDQGGIFTSVTSDYVAMREHPSTGRFLSVYWPGFILKTDEPLESEKGIIGVYRRKGLTCPPWQPTEKLYKFLFPNVDVRLDRGEVDAMKAVAEKFVEPGPYFCLVGGWGLGLPGLIEDQKAVDLYKQAIDTLIKIPHVNMLTQPDTLCGDSKEFAKYGLNMPLSLNPYVHEVYTYARAKGVGFPMLLNGTQPPPKLGFDDLLCLGDDGKRLSYNMALSRQYIDFAYQAFCEFRRQAGLTTLTVDGVVIEPDYDTNHGYLPGRASLYPQYAYLLDLYRRIKVRFQDIIFRVQAGHTSLGPWISNYASTVHNAHDHLVNTHRNFLDFHAAHHVANNMRVSDWFTSQCKMFPRHKMNSEIMQLGFQIRAWDYLGWEYSVLSQIANADVLGEIDDLPDEKQGEVFPAKDVRFFEKWVHWHKERQHFYRRSRDLFGEPRPNGIDGYAYSDGRQSLLFLCNPTYRTRPAAIPLNEEIHLSAGRYTIRELYPGERQRIGSVEGLFEFGSLFVTDVPPQTVMAFEISPDDPAGVLLLGVEGKIQITDEGFELSDLTGPPGRERLLAIRVPRQYAGKAAARLNGRSLPVRRRGGLLLGRVRFGGEPLDSEVKQWRAERKGDGLRLSARLRVPEAARSVLESQRYPVATRFNNAEAFSKVAWLGAHRFIIFLPILPPEVNSEMLTGEAIGHLESTFRPLATLNDQPIPVFSNLMSLNWTRWSGFFIDATERVKYGTENRLELKFPVATTEDRFYGIYLPNLTSQKTSEVLPLNPPDELPLRSVPEAVEAFVPVPLVSEAGDRETLHLRLTVSGAEQAVLRPSEITVEGGVLGDVHILGADPRWLIDPTEAQSGAVLLSGCPKQIYLMVSGNGAARVRLGTDRDQCGFTLSELLAAWRARGDPYDPLALEKTWPARQAEVTVELVSKWQEKMAVSEH